MEAEVILSRSSKPDDNPASSPRLAISFERALPRHLRFLDRLRSICHPIITDRKDLLFDIVDEILQPPIDLRLEATFNRLGGRVDQSSEQILFPDDIQEIGSMGSGFDLGCQFRHIGWATNLFELPTGV